MAKAPANKNKPKAPEDDESLRLPVNLLLPVDKLLPAKGMTVETHKINEIAAMLWLPKSLSKDERNARIIRAIDLYEGLKPTDGAETMLAAQMVGADTAVLECMRRAALDGQSFEGRDRNLKQATKLMALYAKQLDTLNKHRGKGQQKVTVEHVNVAAGGQAIVGNVDTQSRAGDTADQPAALEAPSEVPIDVTLAREPSKSKVIR